MRLPVFAILAFVASGCTIHVVEQPATPTLVAAAPTPVCSPRSSLRTARPFPRQRSGYEPVAAPAPARPRARPPAAEPTPPAHAWRVPFRTLAPEPRNVHPAAVARSARQRPPANVKHPEPLAKITSARVAKAQ